MRNTSSRQLASTNNPCVVAPRTFNRVLHRYRWRADRSDLSSFGIVAKCGSSSVVLQLPSAGKVNLDRMGQTHAEIVRLWNLASDIAERVFGPKDIFHDRSEKDDLALQRAGEKLVPELISGPYDLGLRAAVEGERRVELALSKLPIALGRVSRADQRRGCQRPSTACKRRVLPIHSLRRSSVSTSGDASTNRRHGRTPTDADTGNGRGAGRVGRLRPPSPQTGRD